MFVKVILFLPSQLFAIVVSLHYFWWMCVCVCVCVCFRDVGGVGKGMLMRVIDLLVDGEVEACFITFH